MNPNPREALREAVALLEQVPAMIDRGADHFAIHWDRKVEPYVPDPVVVAHVAKAAELRDRLAALAAQPPAVSVGWRDGFPPLTKLDDKPCKGPDGRPIPPMRESDEVIVCTDDGRVVMDHCCAIGDGMPLWFLNARRVIGWMTKPATLNPESPDA